MFKDIAFYTRFEAKDATPSDSAHGIKVIEIRGTALDLSVNRNGWRVSPEAMREIATTLKGKQLRVDHDALVGKVTGIVKDTFLESDKVGFVAELASANPDIFVPVLRGYVNAVSIGIDPKKIVCDECGEQLKSLLARCHPKADMEVKSASARELSLVAAPAYADTRFIPTSLFQAMEIKLKEQGETMAEPNTAAPTATPPAPAAAPATSFDAAAFTKELTASLNDSFGKRLDALGESVKELKAAQAKKPEATPEKPNGAGLVAGEQPAAPESRETKIRRLEASAIEELFQAAAGKLPLGKLSKDGRVYGLVI